MLLLVQIGKKRWLADVGFGSSYPDLLDFDTKDEQVTRVPEHSVRQCVNTLGRSWNYADGKDAVSGGALQIPACS